MYHDDYENMSCSNPVKSHFRAEQAIFILLVILSLLGIFITDFNPDDGYGYWLLMVFVFGLLSVFVAVFQAKSNGVNFREILKAQGGHWLHTTIVVIAASFLNKTGQLSGVNANLMILLILGLSAMLNGFHIGWEFSLLGFFLVGCAIIIASIKPFMWACITLALTVVMGSFLRRFWLPSSNEKR